MKLFSSCVFSLIFLLPFNCAQLYDVIKRNETLSGDSIEVRVARSFIYCCAMCSQLEICQSVTYDATSRSCNLSQTSISAEELNKKNASGIYLLATKRGTKSCVTSIRNGCTASSECVDSNSECRDGICKCLAGLHHDPNTCACVTVCSEYGGTFQEELGFYISMQNEQNIDGITDSDCRDVCLQATNYTCRSYEYGGNYCRTQTVTSFTHTPTVNSQQVLYTRDCL